MDVRLIYLILRLQPFASGEPQDQPAKVTPGPETAGGASGGRLPSIRQRVRN